MHGTKRVELHQQRSRVGYSNGMYTLDGKILFAESAGGSSFLGYTRDLENNLEWPSSPLHTQAGV